MMNYILLMAWCCDLGLTLVICISSRFPAVIGCFDGTRIPITAPSQNAADDVNKRSIRSINVQVD